MNNITVTNTSCGPTVAHLRTEKVISFILSHMCMVVQRFGTFSRTHTQNYSLFLQIQESFVRFVMAVNMYHFLRRFRKHLYRCEIKQC